MRIWQQILLGLVLGIIVGLAVGDLADYLKPLGTIFIGLIKMIIVPLIFTSIVSSITGMQDMNAFGRLGLKGFVLYLFTTTVAICIGLVIATVLEPGAGIQLNFSENSMAAESPSISQMFINMVPVNPVASMADGKVLQIIVFAIILGAAINLAGDKGKPVADLAHSMAEVTYKITHIIMRIAPIGVFALMAWIAGTQEKKVLFSLIKIFYTLYGGCIIQILCVYGGLVMLSGLNVKHFFTKIIDAQIMAYSTASSAATLPVTMRTVQEKLGVSESTSSFILPLGATVNMDGTAMYQGVVVVFVAQAMGIDLTFDQYLTVILTATLASIGTASVPSAGLITLTLVLTSVGLPLDVIALIAGIDRILDMMRTLTNVTGDAAVAIAIDKSEKRLNHEVYTS